MSEERVCLSGRVSFLALCHAPRQKKSLSPSLSFTHTSEIGFFAFIVPSNEMASLALNEAALRGDLTISSFGQLAEPVKPTSP
jgi:hypothetical protein